VAFWHHHPRDQDRVSCHMNSDLFILVLGNVLSWHFSPHHLWE
jgi:hypothetical protein